MTGRIIQTDDASHVELLSQRLRVFRACPSGAPEGGRSRRKAQP